MIYYANKDLEERHLINATHLPTAATIKHNSRQGRDGRDESSAVLSGEVLLGADVEDQEEETQARQGKEDEGDLEVQVEQGKKKKKQKKKTKANFEIPTNEASLTFTSAKDLLLKLN